MRKGIRLALDYGDKRIGVAKSDVDGILSFPVATLKNSKEVFFEISNLISETNCIEIYIGFPKLLSGNKGRSVSKVLSFAYELFSTTGFSDIRFIDERLTTTTAASALRESGLKAKEQKGVIDQQAAVEILEIALDFEKRNNKVPGVNFKEV
ncbi:MAG: Holliday junction resolvase RuvX [Actinomycetota bacterium]